MRVHQSHYPKQRDESDHEVCSIFGGINKRTRAPASDSVGIRHHEYNTAPRGRTAPRKAVLAHSFRFRTNRIEQLFRFLPVDLFYARVHRANRSCDCTITATNQSKFEILLRQARTQVYTLCSLLSLFEYQS